ncbi:hypothetical protein RhiirB3_442639 [Rhizophagus irregularis]|nr:hypothetical protein RhiirB3_442639 [Rhizophagus irregularis]
MQKNKKHFTVINHTTFIFPITVIDDFDKLNNQKNSSKIISIFKDDEIHNNPNLHSEEQDELELPDNIDN